MTKKMKSFYFKTFVFVCLLPFIGGVISQILRLIYKVNNDLMPEEVSWALLIIGLYGAPGLIIYIRKITFKKIWDKIAYGLLTFQLVGAVIVHAYILLKGSANVLHAFPYKYWYSFIAVSYFLAMGLYVLYLNKRFYRLPKK